jgi:hypothetical protein
MNNAELSYSMMDPLGGHLQHDSIAAPLPNDPNNSGTWDLTAEGSRPATFYRSDSSSYSGSDDESGYVHVHRNNSCESLGSDPGYIEDIAEIARPLQSLYTCAAHAFAQ